MGGASADRHALAFRISLAVHLAVSPSSAEAVKMGGAPKGAKVPPVGPNPAELQFAGPYLRYNGGCSPTAPTEWTGSVLIVTKQDAANGGGAGGGAPALTLVDSLRDADAAVAPDETSVLSAPTKLDECNGWTFWRFELSFELAIFQRSVQYGVTLPGGASVPTYTFWLPAVGQPMHWCARRVGFGRGCPGPERHEPLLPPWLTATLDTCRRHLAAAAVQHSRTSHLIPPRTTSPPAPGLYSPFAGATTAATVSPAMWAWTSPSAPTPATSGATSSACTRPSPCTAWWAEVRSRRRGGGRGGRGGGGGDGGTRQRQERRSQQRQRSTAAGWRAAWRTAAAAGREWRGVHSCTPCCSVHARVLLFKLLAVPCSRRPAVQRHGVPAHMPPALLRACTAFMLLPRLPPSPATAGDQLYNDMVFLPGGAASLKVWGDQPKQ